jgi:hypothetical protein
LPSPSSASPDVAAAIGQTVLYAVNIGALTGGWLADMNKTHMYNPRWTPHAKFHDGITISAASLAGAAGLYFLARRPFGQPADTTIAALLPAIIFGSQAFAFLLPGAEGLEAAAPEMVPHLGRMRVNELPAALAGVALAGLGYFLTTRKRKLRCSSRAEESARTVAERRAPPQRAVAASLRPSAKNIVNSS